MEVKRIYDLFTMRMPSVNAVSRKSLLACAIPFFVILGFGTAKSESEVTYENSDMPLFYYRTAENIQERFEFKKAWYARINELILELNPESHEAFAVSKPKDGDSINVERNYSGDVDLIMLISELEDRELFRLTCEASRKETWKDLNIERGISRLRKDVLRQTRILEKEKFEPLTIVCESTFNSYRYILLSGTMPQKNASRYNDLEEGVVPEKVRFDCILRIGGKATCLAQRGNFWFDRKWIYSSDSENSDKIYVRRYFHVYGKRLSEFVEDLKKYVSRRITSFCWVHGKNFIPKQFILPPWCIAMTARVWSRSSFTAKRMLNPRIRPRSNFGVYQSERQFLFRKSYLRNEED